MLSVCFGVVRVFGQTGLSRREYRPYLRSMLVHSIVVNLLVLVPSIHMLQVYDRVLSSGSLTTLLYITLIVIALLICWGIADAVRSRIAVRLAAAYSIDLAQGLFTKLANGGNANKESAKVWRDFSTARGFLSGKAFIGLFDLAFIPLYVGVMFMLHWMLGFLVIGAIVIMLFTSWLNVTFTDADRIKSRQAESDAGSYAQAVLAQSSEMRIFGVAGHFLSIWSQKFANALVGAEYASQGATKYQAVSKTIRQILQVLTMAVGAYLVVTGNMSAGMIFMASMVSGRALAPIDQFTGGWEQISKGFEALRDIDAFAGDRDSATPKAVAPKPQAVLDSRNIVWAPDSQRPDRVVLDQINLSIRGGEAVVITGATGAGKSALIRILAGVTEPTGGSVKLDNLDAKAWPADSWSHYVGYVPQDISFFPGTVAANIARFDMSVADQVIIETAKLAGAHDMIMRLPDGYSTKIGYGSSILSAGQKQQIALARALFPRPKIILLDEPNSHLDAEGEEAMMRALSIAKRDGAAIVITAHRNTILKIADRVFMMRNGKLEALPFQQPTRGNSEQPTPERASLVPRLTPAEIASLDQRVPA